jgi:hypothetical protein
MKKRLGIFMAVCLLCTTLGLASGLRLGISAIDHPYGAQVVETYYGYPAYGYFLPGDIVTSVGYYYGNVTVFQGYAMMGQTRITPVNPAGTKVYGSQHLQSLIMGAPYNSTVAFWILRNGYYRLMVIQLLNPNGVNNPIPMMVP